MFRFEDLEIWKEAIALSDEWFEITGNAEDLKLFRFVEKLRGAALIISNNIAEGSGYFSDKDFANYLNFARRSLFECANILVIFKRKGLIDPDSKNKLLNDLDMLAGKITNFRKSLNRK